MSKIDIIIPTHNNEKEIRNCLASIYSQTFQDFKVILVNDGSTDKTQDIINGFIDNLENNQKAKIKVINQENKGSNPARNRGSQEATAEYILFCDADINLNNYFLQLMKKKLVENQNTSFCYSSFKHGWKTFKLWSFDVNKLKQMPYIHTTSLIRRNHFPGFDENIKRLQDWDLWLTMLEQGHLGVWVDKVLFKVNTKDGKISNWLPKFAYNFSFLKSVKQYNQAVKVIKNKHHL